MPLPTPPPSDSWWAYHSKPQQQVYVYTTATRWDDRTEQVVVYAEVLPLAEGATEPQLAPATFIDLKLWYNRFDAVDPNAPVEMTVDLNKPAAQYTAAELARITAILKTHNLPEGPAGG